MSRKPDRFVARAVDEQVASNRSSLPYATTFDSHRARLTAEIVARAPVGGAGRLCLLGAGNANDVELDALGAAFAEVHLVDIDAAASEGARARAGAAIRDKVIVQAPVDVSGFWPLLGGWASHPPTPADLAEAVPDAAVRAFAAVRHAPFDVVVSSCMLTQLQLTLLQAVGEANPAFELLRTAVNAIHVRLLLGLMAPRAGAVGLLVTDLTTSDIYPPLPFLPPDAPDAELRRLMADLVARGQIIHAAHPGSLSREIRNNPALDRSFAVRFPIGPWLWRNGPEMTFLVYALEVTRRAQAAGQAGGGTDGGGGGPGSGTLGNPGTGPGPTE